MVSVYTLLLEHKVIHSIGETLEPNSALLGSTFHVLITHSTTTLGTKTLACNHGGHTAVKALTNCPWRTPAPQESRLYYTDHGGIQHYGNQGFPTLIMEDTVKLHSSQAARKTVSNLAFSPHPTLSSPAKSLLM